MGKAGRFACILTPMLCTLASLLCTLIVVIGGTNKSSAPISGLYFFKLDVRNLTIPSSLDVVPGINLDNQHLSTGLNLTAKDLSLEDFYTSSLWNYCSGSISGSDWNIAECGKPSAKYFFDIINIVDSSVKPNAQTPQWPDSVRNVNKAVGWASKVMVAMYVIGLITTFVTFGIGWFGLLSRWGSCVTTILADISFLFILTGSIISTALYYSMRETYNKALADFNVKASVNNQMFTITWLAVAFSLAASIFWMFSTCCCSGRRARVMGTDHTKKAVTTGPGGHGYERIAAPYTGGSVGGHSVPMTEMGKKQSAAYEPYRHA